METKYTPVTHADRIALLTNQNDLVAENDSSVHLKKILMISLLGIAAIIYVSDYLRRKSKEKVSNKFYNL